MWLLSERQLISIVKLRFGKSSVYRHLFAQTETHDSFCILYIEQQQRCPSNIFFYFPIIFEFFEQLPNFLNNSMRVVGRGGMQFARAALVTGGGFEGYGRSEKCFFRRFGNFRICKNLQMSSITKHISTVSLKNRKIPRNLKFSKKTKKLRKISALVFGVSFPAKQFWPFRSSSFKRGKKKNKDQGSRTVSR